MELRALGGRAVLVRRGGIEEATPPAVVSRRGRHLAGLVAGGAGVPVEYADPVRGVVEVIAPEEPTPWATGLPISVFTATTVAFVVATLTAGLTEVSGWLALLTNLLVAVGLVPSVKLAQSLPVWRWLAYGVIAGIPSAWLVLPIGLLG